MTKKQKKDYLKLFGMGKCPFCKSNEIEGESIEIDCDYAFQIVRCIDCGKVWRDVYNLCDVEEVK